MQITKVTAIIQSLLPEPHASLLNGILFGIPLNNVPNLYRELKTVGLLHIVVLSGMNITLLSAIIINLTKGFGKFFSLILTIAIIIIFISFVGPQPPLVRAGIMGILTLIALYYGRKSEAIYSLFISLLLIGIFRSEWLSSISLQLSYGATLGIVLFGEKSDQNKSNKINYIKSELRTSLSAQIFTAPLIFIFFRQLSLISPLSNILVAWTIAPLMIFGLITVIIGVISTTLALPTTFVCYLLLEYILTIVHLLAKIPYAIINF